MPIDLGDNGTGPSDAGPEASICSTHRKGRARKPRDRDSRRRFVSEAVDIGSALCGPRDDQRSHVAKREASGFAERSTEYFAGPRLPKSSVFVELRTNIVMDCRATSRIRIRMPFEQAETRVRLLFDNTIEGRTE